MTSSKSKDEQIAMLNEQNRKSKESDNDRLILALQSMQDEYEQRVG